MMMRTQTFISLAAILLNCALVAPVASQTQKKADDKDQTVRLKTDLIEIRAVVTDRQGKLVDVLKKEDFELLENNRSQDIGFFSVERVVNGATGGSAPVNDKVPGGITGRKAAPGRTIVLFVDALHLTASGLVQVKRALRNFVDHQMTDQDLVAFVSSGGSLGLLGQFTQDRQLLRYAIDRLPQAAAGQRTYFTPNLAAQIVLRDEEALTMAAQIVKAEEGIRASPPGLEPDHFAKVVARARAVEILNETENKRKLTLVTLKEVADRLASVPGQRLIVYYSDGFSMRGTRGEIEAEDVQSVTSRAARSGVVIYSIDVRGLYVNPIFDIGAGDVFASGNTISLVSSYLSASNREAEDGMNALADDTGGKAFFNTNDLNGALGKALDENSVYYSLAYYPADPVAKGFHRITLRVKDHPEYRVRTQKGYMPIEARKAQSPQTPQEKLSNAMMSPLALTEIGVSASADYLAREGDDAQVTYEAHIDGRNLNYKEQNGLFHIGLEVVSAIYDLSGKRVDAWAETVNANLSQQRLEIAKRNGINYAKRLALKPGLYQIRVGVRELSTERIGSATAWVEVADLTRGKLKLSGIFLGRDLNTDGTTPANGKSTEPAPTRTVEGIRAYEQGQYMVYHLMIYTPAREQAKSELMMQVAISRAGEKIYQGPWQPIGPLVVKENALGLDIGGQFKLAAPPGIYELTLSVKDSKSKEPAEKSVMFAVEQASRN
ncbi:MAG TPA: VWA domain-containing protein [Blastocatellia bacterium]|nr:VWA domain-containing protein [Blastocatellia bacterium]